MTRTDRILQVIREELEAKPELLRDRLAILIIPGKQAKVLFKPEFSREL